MPSIKLNFSGVKSIEPVPTGIYPVEIASWEMAEGPKGPYLAWTFNITAPEYENRKLFSNTSLAENARWKIMELLMACGIEESDLKKEDGSDVDLDPDALIGTPLRLSVLQSDVNGRLQNDVTQFLPLASAAPVVKAPATAAASAKGAKAAAGTPPAAVAAPAPRRKIVG